VAAAVIVPAAISFGTRDQWAYNGVARFSINGIAMAPRRLCLTVAVISLATSLAGARDDKKDAGQPPVRRPANPALQPIQDVPGLSRVLLIGDSISIGYTVPTRALLKGVANVHRPPTNCGPSTKGIQEIDRWLGDGPWDVIHFNFGLHDLKFVDEAGKNVSPDKGKVQVSVETYAKNLDALVVRMKKTGAKLIFAMTTSVPASEPQRTADSERTYNLAAAEVMKRHGVAINDLNAFVHQRQEKIQLPKNVHFTAEGYRELAGQVATEIKKALAK
jgi:hypothetical protein